MGPGKHRNCNAGSKKGGSGDYGRFWPFGSRRSAGREDNALARRRIENSCLTKAMDFPYES